MLYEVITETFIKSNAPGSLYGEWAKKDECWSALKQSNVAIDIEVLKGDLVVITSYSIHYTKLYEK